MSDPNPVTRRRFPAPATPIRATLVLAAALMLTHAPALARQPASPVKILREHKDPLRRESAALVLGRRGARSALAALLHGLRHDDNLWVRAACARALGWIGDRAAIKPLAAALEREKKARVRRSVAQALVQLGQKDGLLELMWQLRSGTNHDKAEAMSFLVAETGQPLGQWIKGWWSYLAKSGYRRLARRPWGSPALLELGPRTRLFGVRRPWQQVPAVVVELGPTRQAITPKLLRRHRRRHGSLPDGAVLILRTRWSEAKPPKPRPPAKRDGKQPKRPGPSASGAPARALLLSRGKLVLEGLDGLGRINSTGTRLLLFRSAKRAHVLAILP
jgi:hypothetical protein